MLTDSSANGVIASFARHPTAANLIIALMVVCGLYAITNLNRQFFPDFGIDYVPVDGVWTGACAQEVGHSVRQSVGHGGRILRK